MKKWNEAEGMWKQKEKLFSEGWKSMKHTEKLIKKKVDKIHKDEEWAM